MALVLKRIEMYLGETLQQHGVTLPDHDLTLLHSLQKPNKNSEQSCITKISSVDPKPISPAISPLVSQAKGKVIVLTEPSVQALGKPENETNDLNCQTTTEKSIPPTVTHVTLQSDIGECKNKFLENLALTQIVPTRAISNLSAKRILRLSPARKYSSSPKRKIEPPPKILPSVPNGKITTNNTSISASSNAASAAPPNDQISPENVRLVSKVRIIDLPAKDLQVMLFYFPTFTGGSCNSSIVYFPQNLQNNKSHIQYMTTKKDPSPQEVSLLRKLLLHQKKILASGRVVMPIPGETVKGIPFLSGACMYVVQSSKGQVMPDTGQTSNKVVVPIPCIEKAPPATGENRSNCSPNLHQTKHSATEKLLELATNNRCNYIFPDAEKTVCNHHSCVLQVALLKSEVNQKSIALESCNSELANVRAELGKANEYISNLRAQLEENTHTLCSYLAASSHVTYK